MSLALPPEFESFVSVRVASGAYASEQDVLRTAFDLLEAPGATSSSHRRRHATASIR